MGEANNVVRLHRVLTAPAERVYRAFIEADALARWLPPYGIICTVHASDARVGGRSRMSFANFSTGNGHAFEREYLALEPHTRIVYLDRFDDPNLPGDMKVTVTLREVVCGTELNIVHENIPDPIPVEMCYLGWQEGLIQLAHLVEPNIPDNV